MWKPEQIHPVLSLSRQAVSAANPVIAAKILVFILFPFLICLYIGISLSFRLSNSSLAGTYGNVMENVSSYCINWEPRKPASIESLPTCHYLEQPPAVWRIQVEIRVYTGVQGIKGLAL